MGREGHALARPRLWPTARAPGGRARARAAGWSSPSPTRSAPSPCTLRVRRRRRQVRWRARGWASVSSRPLSSRRCADTTRAPASRSRSKPCASCRTRLRPLRRSQPRGKRCSPARTRARGRRRSGPRSASISKRAQVHSSSSRGRPSVGARRARARQCPVRRLPSRSCSCLRRCVCAWRRWRTGARSPTSPPSSPSPSPSARRQGGAHAQPQALPSQASHPGQAHSSLTGHPN
mmetsp:Transcript_20035/g.47274  ORF Transcript_20035/g.47274 Transcript_20035/m.47274 type:complete len:234 (-) Transcript_20035:466-1167(-)